MSHASLYRIICSRPYANVVVVNKDPNNLPSNDLRSAYNREVLSIASTNVNTPTRRRPVIDRSYHTDLYSWNESLLETWSVHRSYFLGKPASSAEKRFARLVRRIRMNSSDQRVTLYNKGNSHANKLSTTFGNRFVLMSYNYLHNRFS